MADVIYSFGDNLLFVLLKNNYILLCDTQFNPCLTREIWVPSMTQYKINTLTMVISIAKLYLTYNNKSKLAQHTCVTVNTRGVGGVKVKKNSMFSYPDDST